MLKMAKENSISGIYMICCKPNGKLYIGMSKDIARRWKEHKRDIGKFVNISQCGLKEDVFKYGWENFEFSIIEKCKIEDLKEREKYYIRFYKSYEADKGYNRKTKKLLAEG
jgi:group I intron endonuclease